MQVKLVNGKGNQLWIFIGRMLKLKLQYFGHLMWRANTLEKILMLGKIEGRRRRERQKMRGLDGITDSMDMSLSKFWKMVKDREIWHASVHRVAKNWTPLNDWTTMRINAYNRDLGKDWADVEAERTCVWYITLFCIMWPNSPKRGMSKYGFPTV